MTSKGHKKHTALVRPAMGNWGRNEWAIVGAPCGDIKTLAEKIIAALSGKYAMAYVDAEHNDEQTAVSPRLNNGAVLEYIDADEAQNISLNSEVNPFAKRKLLGDCDVVLLNGNHHQGQQQIVVIDSRKKESLRKRLDQLTAVKLFLLADGETEPFDFIKEAIADWQQIPVFKLSETEQIVNLINNSLQTKAPVLNGLVLAGGKSERMGADKSAINWHGREQQYYMADLLKPYCQDVFISCRDEQKAGIDPNYQTLTDTFTGLGPYGAILSAFRQQPDSAWLVVACDLPLLDRPTLDELIASRSTKHVATTFVSPHDGFPEPLITIWEPKSYAELLSFLGQGYSCPRKVLINTHTHVINPSFPESLTNVNTPEELEKVKTILQQKNITA
ncbi:NTP transferase domain-containing protein [Mucilaginibacter yixingensis]|nr:NTP transferase domain-containing protein [Mucilaginibacter yixingensis]